MKKQVIVTHIKDLERINEIRAKYDPGFKMDIPPPITLVYEFNRLEQKQIAQTKIDEHLKNILKSICPFSISLHGLEKSAKDFYLYLGIGYGREKLIELYNKLNTGALQGIVNPDMPVYVPHVTLGVFKTEKEMDRAIKEIEKQDLTVKTTVGWIDLVTINDDNSKSTKSYYLGR